MAAKKPAAFRVDLEPSHNEVFREIDRRVEGNWEFHVYAGNGVSQVDKNDMTTKAVDLILEVGGEIREDWRAACGLVFYTLPPGVRNPVRTDDPMYRGKMHSSWVAKYSDNEMRVFFGKKGRPKAKAKAKGKRKTQVQVKEEDSSD